MRIDHASWLLPLLALTGCGKAAAASIDPSEDFDCATTAASYLDLAKRSGAPADQQQAFFVLNQWFAIKWHESNPGTRPNTDHALAIANAIMADPVAHKGAVLTCTNRANEDPKFSKFAILMR